MRANRSPALSPCGEGTVEEERRWSWWQRAVIYHIYPRSFADSNGDGVGDLEGIRRKLDYLTWLGVDALWLSPIFRSPMADFGYDISDYLDVDPTFGTLEDLDRLIADAHARGIRVILDFVPNHTSDQHPWFIESRSHRDNPRRDWYIWADPAPDGGPPNNWRSVFGGSAWKFDTATGQYYLHTFLEEQPDLNWRNPEVQAAMLDVLRFWFARGVDGFRLDAIWFLIKDAELRDNPVDPDYTPDQPAYRELLPVYTSDRPEVHDILARMRQVADAFGERLLIGEIYLPIGRLVTYYGCRHRRELHLPFNFQLMLVPWEAQRIAAAIDTYEALLGPDDWPNWVLSNHDRPRVATRIGEEQARVAALLLLTLRGTPTIYYGDELGLADVPIPPDRRRDPLEHTIGPGAGRDPCRTPMPWDTSPYAGFSTVEPWLPLNPDYPKRNVAVQRDDPRSMLSLYRQLLILRRAEPALAIGSYRPVSATRDLLAYLREAAGRRLLVALDFGGREQVFTTTRFTLHGRILLSTHLDRAGEMVSGSLHLRPNEGCIVALAAH
ncbi:alpha-D-1,4-glucosidase [Thermomicrobium roseum DSM 5159]|uniref:Alpha-D-1,4-glucosidase n=1 Tax=Thermomicrobium roseum (strain ATCC 27502 / DSM 5159 / P-2) TaxID=309801 RepID=B9L2A0_THERP|nr:alpha-D-1,4-glucosidase [Thermomicrobium roseum DSM 5159]